MVAVDVPHDGEWEDMGAHVVISQQFACWPLLKD